MTLTKSVVHRVLDEFHWLHHGRQGQLEDSQLSTQTGQGCGRRRQRGSDHGNRRRQ